MTQESGLGKSFILFVAVVTVAAIMSFSVYKLEAKAEHVQELQPVQGWVGSFFSSEIAGYKIIEHVDTFWAVRSCTADQNIAAIIEETMPNFAKYGKKTNSNAAVNIRITSATSEQQGSKWNTATIILYGDVVRLAKVKK